MDKELFKKTEGRVYMNFKYKREIYSLRKRVEVIENQIKDIDDSIRNVHKYINVDPYQNGVEILEKVQTSRNCASYMEIEMEKEITKLEKEQSNKIKSMHKFEVRIRDMEFYVRNMGIYIEMLSEEDKKFIEYKYGKGKKVSYIAMELSVAIATIYRKQEELVRNIACYIKLTRGLV
jgi:hypothetical protein